jgi:hypothetical protein
MNLQTCGRNDALLVPTLLMILYHLVFLKKNFSFWCCCLHWHNFCPALDQLMHFNQVGIYGGPSFPISQSFDLKFLYTIMRQVFTLTSAAVFTLQL